MSMTITAWLAWACGGLAVACLSVLAVRRARLLLALARVPGPLSLPLLGNALLLTGSQEDFFKLLCRLAERYGPMFRLWIGPRPFVFVHSAEAVQPILNSSVHIDKSPDYRFVEPWIGKGLVTSAGEKWRQRRKLLTPSFHSRVLENFMEPLFREAAVLADQLAAKANGLPFDVVPYAKLAALDVICDTVMGKHVGAQRNSSSSYVLAIEKITRIAQRRFITPWLKPDLLFQLSADSREQNKCVHIIHGFTGQVYEDRKLEKLRQRKQDAKQAAAAAAMQGGPQPQPRVHAHAAHAAHAKPAKRQQALLDLLLDMAHQGANLSEEDIREEVDTFTFAGHDTTAAGLSYCLFLLGSNQDAQDRVVQEWREVRGSCPGGELGLRDLMRLEFLERCIKESLRLYPVVPLIARDIRSPVSVLGVDLPAGCTLLVNTYLLHRDARFFPDPERFDPDRFLPDHDTARHPFSYVPFSAGSRNCIGQRFALLELKVLIGTILERFQVHTVEPGSTLHLIAEIVLTSKNGVNISITPRTASQN